MALAAVGGKCITHVARSGLREKIHPRLQKSPVDCLVRIKKVKCRVTHLPTILLRRTCILIRWRNADKPFFSLKPLIPVSLPVFSLSKIKANLAAKSYGEQGSSERFPSTTDND